MTGPQPVNPNPVPPDDDHRSPARTDEGDTLPPARPGDLADSSSIHFLGGRGEESVIEDTAKGPTWDSSHVRVCHACQTGNRPDADYCRRCGFGVSPEARLSLPMDSRCAAPLEGVVLLGKYHVCAGIGSCAGIDSFAAFAREGGREYPVVVRVAQKRVEASAGAEAPLDPPTPPEATDTTQVIEFHPSDVDLFQLERGLVAQPKCLAFPRLLDEFELDQWRGLVTTAAIGMPLLKAWNSANFSEVTKSTWLEQLRVAWMELHEQILLLPTLHPGQVVIDEDGIVRVRDLAGLLPMFSRVFDPKAVNLYTAGEVARDASRADYRADAYAFGAILHALISRRELVEADFLAPGTPRSLAQTHPDAFPPVPRLLGKTFVADPDRRFPTADGRLRDPTGFVELGEALGRCARAVRSVAYDIAGWSSIGILRSNNEDSFAIERYRVGLGEFQRELALVAVADGMGGHASGEIASGLAVASVTRFLGKSGMSVAALARLGRDHPAGSARRLGELVQKAFAEANRRVRKAAASTPGRVGMGCTLEVLVLAGSRAVLGHVGDSRVYQRSGEQLRQVTQDQTLVQRLVALGKLSPEEAVVHPRRGELSQAIGASPTVRPDRHRLDLARGDWVVVCTDGLTAHVADWEIDRVLGEARTAESAARRLVNIANSRGGTDNCTLVVVRVF